MPANAIAAGTGAGPSASVEDFDIIVVGAGFGGLYALHRLRGLGFSVRVYEQGAGVGGTWYWNRYPGARCDVESMQYSYSFSDDLQQEWDWSEKYAPQPEILAYANHVADRFDLRRDIRFETTVNAMAFDDATARWTVTMADGARAQARFVILATGCLSNARMPDIAGRDSFRGRVFHTGHWPHAPVSFANERVAVIGTGSSAIQSIPLIAQEANHLTVFQRTPNFSVPARNEPLTAEERRWWRANYPEMRRRAREEMRNGIVTDLPDRGALDDGEDDRTRRYQARWDRGGITFMSAYNNLVLDRAANETAAQFIRQKISEIVTDPQIARKLQPTDHPVGSKRICVDTDYYATFNRPNVSLVDVRDNPIERITAHGIRAGGQDHVFDSIVFATGFDAMTGSVAKIDIRGVGGQTLNQKWADGPRTYLGLMSAGFPNLFTITGPGSPSVLSNMILAIEQHVDWITGCLDHMRRHGLSRIEAAVPAEDRWVAHVNEVASGTLFPQANSWYMGANIPGKPRIFMPYVGGVWSYRKICDEVAASGYDGFVLSGTAGAANAAAG